MQFQALSVHEPPGGGRADRPPPAWANLPVASRCRRWLSLRVPVCAQRTRTTRGFPWVRPDCPPRGRAWGAWRVQSEALQPGRRRGPHTAFLAGALAVAVPHSRRAGRPGVQMTCGDNRTCGRGLGREAFWVSSCQEGRGGAGGLDRLRASCKFTPEHTQPPRVIVTATGRKIIFVSQESLILVISF